MIYLKVGHRFYFKCSFNLLYYLIYIKSFTFNIFNASTSVYKLSNGSIFILFILGKNYYFSYVIDTRIRFTFFYTIYYMKIFILALTLGFITWKSSTIRIVLWPRIVLKFYKFGIRLDADYLFI